MRTTVATAGALLALAASACSSTTPPAASSAAPRATSGAGPTTAPSRRPTAPTDPANFVGTVTNRWFPLIPGQVRVYEGVRDGRAAHEVFTVTRQTKTILGVTCTVVHDVLTLDGRPAEETDDWYAQDQAGNVWYFGEETATLNPDGSVKTREGTFQAGVDGAQAGIYATAAPRLGVDYRQEYYKGHAEDHFAVTDLGVPVKVRFGNFPNTVRTKEYTPLEPAVIDHKYYVDGIGVVKEESEDGSERLELVSFTRT